MNKIEIDSNNFFSWRRTPWDEKVFELRTMEVTEIVYDDDANLGEIFHKIDLLVKKENIQLLFFRFSSSDQKIKKFALYNGFHIVEHSYYVTNSNICKINSSNRGLVFRKAKMEDLSIIKNIARESFDYGRFHEDPMINLELAKKRYENWISQLIDETNFYVIEVKGEIAGFFNYIVKGDFIDLPLSGVNNRYAGLGGFMWKDMFALIDKIEDIKKVKVMISASNLAVLNLYMSLGFKVTESVFGYHKHITN